MNIHQMVRANFVGVIIGALLVGGSAMAASGPLSPPASSKAGGLPVCTSALLQSQSALDTCSANLTTCTGELAACQAAAVDIKLSTLYRIDPVTRTLCFQDGRGGGVIVNGEGAFNRCSDIDYGNYLADGLSVAVEGARLGVILDLGSQAALAQKYGYYETVGGGQGYASIKLNETRTQVLIRAASPSDDFQVLQESPQLFATGISVASIPAQADHVYLLRLTDGFDPSFELIVKLLLIAHRPGEAVTFRWDPL